MGLIGRYLSAASTLLFETPGPPRNDGAVRRAGEAA
jgi:hypothetical protein